MKKRARNTAQVGWYEAGLSLDERKQRGHFSTPPALVDQILDACGYTSSADLRHLRLLDPACGSGNFLTRAARRLCLSGQAQGLEGVQISTLVQRNLWGLDPDPVACCLAEMQMRSAVEASYEADPAPFKLNIHQADSLTLPWQPCVDLLLANPPYLATKNTDLSRYRQTQQRGQTDSYLLFLELALQAVCPGGWIGLILPDPVLARANASSERARLLSECTLHHLWHLSGVFAAVVGAVVLIAQKSPPPVLHQITWNRAHWQIRPMPPMLNQPVQPHQTVSQELLAHQPGSELRYLLSLEQGQRVERLQRALEKRRATTVPLLPLEELVDIKRGEELGRENPSLRPLVELAEGYPLLRGGVDLQPYTHPTTEWGIASTAIKKPLARYLEPKLLVVKSTERLQASLDTGGHVALQTLYLLILREPDLDTYYFLLALLNSRLLRAYVLHLHTAYKLVQPQIEQTVLARLPIPWGELEARQRIAEQARELERACSEAGPVVEWGEHISSLYEEQERAIRALYAAAVPELLLTKES